MVIDSDRSRLGNIQALRALAALMVVVLHSYGLGTKAGHDLRFLAGADPWGNAGVDLFFVISGFIMVHIQTARDHSPGRFLANRAARVVPLYWLITGLFAWAIARGTMAPVDAGPFQPWTSFLFLSRSLSGADPILYVGWTLEYEMFFYLCFAIAIAIARRIRIDLILVLTALVLGSILLLGVGIVALEFLFGAWVARVLPSIRCRPMVGATFGIVGIVLLAMSFGSAAAYEQRVLYFGIPATMILAGAIILPQRAGPISVMLGDASYSLYLVHLFALAFMFALLPVERGWMALIIAIVATQLFALLVHRLVERPLGTLGRQPFRWVGRPRSVRPSLQA